MQLQLYVDSQACAGTLFFTLFTGDEMRTRWPNDVRFRNAVWMILDRPLQIATDIVRSLVAIRRSPRGVESAG
jgi:hypothetical protein